MIPTDDSAETERLRQQLFGNFTEQEHFWIQLYLAMMGKETETAPPSWMTQHPMPSPAWIGLTPGRLYVPEQGTYDDLLGVFTATIGNPQKTWEYIGMMRAIPSERQVDIAAREFFDLEPSTLDAVSRKSVQNLLLEINEKNVLKRVRKSDGQDISAVEYYHLVQQLLNHPFLLQHCLGKHAETVFNALKTGDFCRSIILEEVVDEESRNPNVRVRLFLDRLPGLEEGGYPLDHFVKFYSAEQKEQRDFEACLNHYLGGTTPVASVGRAQSVDVPVKILLPRGNTSVICEYALVTPFAAEVETLDSFLARSPQHKMAVLQDMNDVLVQLHQQGLPNLGVLRMLQNMADLQEQEFLESKEILQFSLDITRDMRKDAQLLREHFYTPDGQLQQINYTHNSHVLFKAGGKLDEVYNEQYIISSLLEEMALFAPSFIHGDVRPKNVLVSPTQSKLILTDFEEQFVGFGAPQEDLAKLYSYRSLGLSMEEQESLVHDYVQKRELPKHYANTEMNIEGFFLLGYHAAVIYKTLVHLKYTHEQSHVRYTSERAEEMMEADLQVIELHAGKLSEEGISLLREAICAEYEFTP